MRIRAATETDLAEMQAIYAHHVLHGTGTFEDIPPSIEEMTERFTTASASGWAWLVAADDTGLLGYAYYTPFGEIAAFRSTAEDRIYVREDVRGQGVGKALGAALLERAAAQGFRQMIAVIGDSESVGSIGVHASLGFQRAGLLRASGRKFGRWLDLVYMQRALDLMAATGGPRPGAAPGSAPKAAPPETGPRPADPR